jgi:hypothetical protein
MSSSTVSGAADPLPHGGGEQTGPVSAAPTRRRRQLDDTALLRRALNALTELEYGYTDKSVAMATAATAALRKRLEAKT